MHLRRPVLVLLLPGHALLPTGRHPAGAARHIRDGAASIYAGIQVRGSLREMEARLEPWRGSAARTVKQEQALDEAAGALVPMILGGGNREEVGASTLRAAAD